MGYYNGYFEGEFVNIDKPNNYLTEQYTTSYVWTSKHTIERCAEYQNLALYLQKAEIQIKAKQQFKRDIEYYSLN
jgi:hypothetical protein